MITLTEPLNQTQRDWQMVRTAYEHGFTHGLREGLSQGPNHPAVQQSVANMFGDWQGADQARQHAAQRFWQQRIGDAA